MKKNLFFVAAAALMLASCSNDVKLDENIVPVGSNKQNEIALNPLAKKPNRKPAAAGSIITNSFPADNTMEVKAYQTVPTAGAYFEKCTFTKGETYWGGSQYWPLSASKINFFAVSGFGLTASHITIADELASAGVAYTTANSYSATTQSDIMYAFARGAVTQSDNTLSFPEVPMVFKHALALVDFEVKGFSATEVGAITVNSITLKGATYNGTLTLTNTNAATEADAVTTAVSWAAGDEVASVAVPGISSGTAITDTYARIGNGLMVIPGTGFDSFVINYSFGGKAYDYEYTPSPAVTSTTAANKYTYQITFKLHEILVEPSVGDWANGGSTEVTF